MCSRTESWRIFHFSNKDCIHILFLFIPLPSPPPLSPLISQTKLTAEKLSELHRSSHNQLVHKWFHFLWEIRSFGKICTQTKKKKDPHLQSARGWKAWSFSSGLIILAELKLKQYANWFPQPIRRAHRVPDWLTHYQQRASRHTFWLVAQIKKAPLKRWKRRKSGARQRKPP